ncbi:hypothetical protein D3790_02080 [Xenorhabdus nematophila]|nr:hypothetical protein D3790_02080 [Xenorhabdus nematophila]KHD27170.1 hypothetical protein LH67_20405 [Xenorhabdus nematophila]CEF31330.1 hypothetical protein XNW1_3370001 [Xenorhabdus nematophila str. Websteri]
MNKLIKAIELMEESKKSLKSIGGGEYCFNLSMEYHVDSFFLMIKKIQYVLLKKGWMFIFYALFWKSLMF